MEHISFKELLNLKGKKILHTTHVKSDCDGIASIYWGLSIFGGSYFIPPYELRSAAGLIEMLNLKNSTDSIDDFDIIFIYDTEKRQDLPFKINKPYVIFDHHHKRDGEFVENALFCYIEPSSANVINLYNLSIKENLPLNDEILFSFAVALYTDTAMFRTAREGEFFYFSKFLKNRRFEDILDVVYYKDIDKSSFLKTIKKAKFYNINGLNVCVLKFKDNDQFYGFVDGLFNILNLDVLIGILKEGIKIHVKKRHVQKIYHMLFVPIQKKLNIERVQGIWMNFFDYKILLKALEDYKGGWTSC